MNSAKIANILIIDDDKGVVFTLSKFFERMGHRVACGYSLEDGYGFVREHEFDVIFLDVQLPDGNGLEFLMDIENIPVSALVIIMTSFPDPDGAESAIQYGAWDYLEKPISLKTLKLQLLRALQYRKQKRNTSEPRVLQRNSIVGSSILMQTSLDTAAKAAANTVNVLITGETGTGKELFAKAIHESSQNRRGDFVVVDCGILTETLLESTLFGHEKGAFTGAVNEGTGLIRIADKGTLFLDEVGELPLTAQRSFLRVLQEHRFRPMGARQEFSSDFRLISATNQDLEQMVAAGKFRKDLYYRLNSIHLELPPLRTHKTDIEELVAFYLARSYDRYGLSIKECSPEFLSALHNYQWPGNTRELVNILDSAVAAAQGEETLFPVHLPKQMRISLVRSSVDKKNAPLLSQVPDPVTELPPIKDLIQRTEISYFKSLIAYTSGDIPKMCKISGLSRAMVYARLKKYRLSRR